ncbi:hypothetical protein BJ878DRAFT_481459 [Calycina marina]|uniref:Protein Zds1 C-terminal domain-containing protein n=1 Tax=Calycina marina TaxID=1763456 RepID=A0A9P8CF77_9HELO|nr:hypothetical protein BJ878DRAFT_481459 [Calycina marina]
MKTSSRPRNLGGSFASRRGHIAQLSISDTNHHVTEAIGDMYGDDDEYLKRDSVATNRPLSFITSPTHESPTEEGKTYFDSDNKTARRPPPTINGANGNKAHTSPAILQSPRSNVFENKGPLAPSLSLRDRNTSDTAYTQFPLNDIDYESDPAAVAQELSNLQALRRMSMDVGNTSDPDLPSFQGVSLMPSVAPTGDDNEDDPSRLFWVPARVHPELAPMEFKTFLENRVQTIKRRSGDSTSLSPDGLDKSGCGGGLRRKKSMLSRQINNDGGRGAIGYKDGAEQLERKKSLSVHQTPDLKISDLQELETLAKDPTDAVQKLSLDTSGSQTPVADGEDMPILPLAPKVGLRRSTHTTYRRGSLRKERVPFSKRAGSLRSAETDVEESQADSPIDSRPAGFPPLTKVSSEPVATENFSRPSRGGRRTANLLHKVAVVASSVNALQDMAAEPLRRTSDETKTTTPEAGKLRRSSSFPRDHIPVPQIVATPPPDEYVEPPAAEQKVQKFPIRSSSQSAPPPSQTVLQEVIPLESPARSANRSNLDRSASSNSTSRVAPPIKSPSQPVQPILAARQIQPVLVQPVQPAQPVQPSQQVQQLVPAPVQTLNEMAQHPSPLHSSNASTDSLTFIPTLDEKKPEKKSKKDKDEHESGSRKPSWGWFKGSDEKEKKERKQKEREDELKKAKIRTNFTVDKAHDSARLDVLQSTVDSAAPRGRESLLLDRDSVDYKLHDAQKKESSRKSSDKKEKDGIFSSLFGGKKKSDRDSGGKKAGSLRTLSPDPPHRSLKPDIDYHWTRFPILEERAIYRMAHIKLANPRRALYSQVLLSNFMYSYLAKVQQMNPHIQVPQSAMQKKQEAERQRKEAEQRQREEQQRHESEEQYRYDYHLGIAQYAEQDQNHKEGAPYVDDSQIYDYDHHQDNSHGHRPQSRTGQHDYQDAYGDQVQQYGRQGNDYHHQQYGHSDQSNHEDDEMW